MPPVKRQKITPDVKESREDISDQPNVSKETDDWRESAISNKDRHKHALKQGILTDVTFAVGPEKALIHAHKTILSLASPVFEAMFYGFLKESDQTISIPDLTPTGFQLLLDFIYTDDVKLNTETEAFCAWIAADKYCLTHMKDICYKHLSHCTMTNDNVWVILENALFLESQFLIDRCLSYLITNISEALKSPSFLETSSETPKRVLLMDSLRISEISLLLSLVRWSKEKIKNGVEESLPQLLQPFLGYIRFGCMTINEFVGFIDEHKGIISDSDALAILKFMTNDRLYSLPEWCSSSVNSRKAFYDRRVANRLGKVIRAYALKPRRTAHKQHSSRSQDDPEANDSEDYHHPDNLLYRGHRTDESIRENDDSSGSDSSYGFSSSDDEGPAGVANRINLLIRNGDDSDLSTTSSSSSFDGSD